MKKVLVALALSVSSVGQLAAAEAKLSFVCNEENAWPDAGRSVKVFETSKGFHVDYVWYGMSGREQLMESIGCRDLPVERLTSKMQALYECGGSIYRITLYGNSQGAGHAGVTNLVRPTKSKDDGRDYPCISATKLQAD